MKVFAAVLLLFCLASAQSTAPPASNTQSGSSTGLKKPAPTTPDRTDVATSENSKPADIKEVRRNLEALKTAVGKMDEGPAHDMAEQNVKFLESLVSYLEHEKPSSGASRTSPRSSTQPSAQAPQGVAGENPK